MRRVGRGQGIPQSDRDPNRCLPRSLPRRGLPSGVLRPASATALLCKVIRPKMDKLEKVFRDKLKDFKQARPGGRAVNRLFDIRPRLCHPC